MRAYRIVSSAEPSTRDFLSYAAQGVLPRGKLTAAQQRAWAAVSVYSDLGDAHRLAAYDPDKGAWIAVLDLPDDGTIAIQQQGRIPSHHNVWADPAFLLARVVDVIPAEEGSA